MRQFLLLTAMALIAVAPARAGEPPSLDAALKEEAKKILDYARDHKAKNIGVLKFLVRTGDGPFSDNAGPLNNGLADRLSVALVLALPDDKEFGIIGNTEKVLENNRNANHLDEDGRARCFKAKGYTLAWGDPEIVVDDPPKVFVTGTVTLSKDLKQTTVRFQAFHDKRKLDELGEITVATTTRTLIDTGHSYLMTRNTNPDLFKGARGRPTEDLDKDVTDASQKYKADLNNNPSFEREAPVKVTIYYNDKEVAIDKNGNVPEPKVGDKVWFKIENRSEDIHGVVLKVNGENTIFRERFDDRDCRKWLLAPRGKKKEDMRDTVVVKGYQVDDNFNKEFEVKPPEVSKENEVHYGPLAGTFQITVFHGKDDKPDPEPKPPVVKPEPKPQVVKEDDPALVAISRGTLKVGDNSQAGSLNALQAYLRDRERERGAANARGIIGGAEDSKSNAVVRVPFVADPPIPVMSYRIRYYQPSNGK